MSRKISRLRTGALCVPACLALVLAAFDGAAAEDASELRLTRVDGQATVKHYGVEKSSGAEEGAILVRGDVVETADKSFVVVSWSNGSMVRVYPNSRISIDGIVLDLEKKTESSNVVLEKGRIFVKAQSPENLFTEFRIRASRLTYLSQGAEFALALDGDGGTSLYTLLGRVVTDVDNQRYRIDDGKQFVAKSPPEGKDVAAESGMSEKTRETLKQTSKDLGGSLLAEEEGKAGGPLKIRVGGVLARRGNAPYKVTFKALVSGGSGRIKKIEWDFGDGTKASTRAAEHTFTQGLYIVILRVEDENGEKAAAQINISAELDCGC